MLSGSSPVQDRVKEEHLKYGHVHLPRDKDSRINVHDQAS